MPVAAAVGERGAVLGDVERRHVVLVAQPHEQLVERVRVDLPAHAGVLAALGLGRRRARRSSGSACDDVAAVVVDAEEVERLRDRRRSSSPIGGSNVARSARARRPGTRPGAPGRGTSGCGTRPRGARAATSCLDGGQRVHRDQVERDARPSRPGHVAAEHLRRRGRARGGRDGRRRRRRPRSLRPGACSPRP